MEGSLGELKTPPSMKLFWMTTRPQSGEDWFVIAENAHVAREMFTSYHGFGESIRVRASFVRDVPETIDEYHRRWSPSYETLKVLGCQVVSDREATVVRYQGRLFKQGDVVQLTVEHLSNTGVYFLKVFGMPRYKIGCTTNLRQRIRDISNVSPMHMQLVEYIESSNPVYLESLLHKKFRTHRIKNEWFEFTDEQFVEVIQFARRNMY